MAILYVHPGLATGANDGSTEANAFQSWSALATAVNASYSDLVTAAEGLTVKVLGDLLTMAASTGAVFAVESNATYPLIFEVDQVNRSPGVWSTSAPGFANTNFAYNMMTFNERVASAPLYVEFRGLQFDGRYQDILINLPATIVVDSCYMKFNAGGTNPAGIFYRATNPVTATVKNCIMDGFANTGTGAKAAVYALNNASVVDFHNNTCIDFTTTSGVMVPVNVTTTATLRAVNNLFVNCTALGTWAETQGDVLAYNATTSASGYGSTNTTYDISSTGLFVSGTDRHLQSANAWGVGPSDGTYGSYVPTTDIDGDTRSGTTASVGADEIVAASGPTPPYVSVSIS